MAKIFKTDMQEQALREITDSLKIVDSLNRVLADENISDCKLKITGLTGFKAVNEQFPIPFNLISTQLKDYRKRLIKDISDKSKTYSIRLEDSEYEIIGVKNVE